MIGLVAGLAALLVSGAAVCHASGLIDNPLLGEALQYLDGEQWIVTNNATTVTEGFVPGDLITDLQRGGLIGDPIYESNFRNPLWDSSPWTYSVTFDVDADVSAGSTVLLVFDGVKMAADATLNGATLGGMADQFLRYSFDVTNLLRPTDNTLTVTFPTSADPRNNEGRFMACTGGWDWAPMSNTETTSGTLTMSKGIWKSVYLAATSSLTIDHIVPQVFYNGTYPTAPLTDTTHGGFTVAVRVHMTAPAAVSGLLQVQAAWGATASAKLQLSPGSSNVTLVLPAQQVKLWWPAGLGDQVLYAVNVSFTPSGAPAPALFDGRRIGFRVFTLVTGNDTDPSTLANKDGSDTFTMRFKVNGANIWSRGGNMIPMEEFEGRANADALRILVQSAVDANMNTFRLWGGGIFMYDAWYDAADELGVLIYHDMMYAQQGHAPANTSMQDAELRHQVRRLSTHPSIALWDSCNECGGHGIYASFVLTTVVEEDASRPVWPSCPSIGWSSGVDRLWSLPNGSPLGLQPRVDTPDAKLQQASAPTAPVSQQQQQHESTKRKSPGAGCTFQQNADYDHGTDGPNAPATDPNACCSLCAARSDCVAASFYDGTCWFKNASQAQPNLVSYFCGCVACWPAGHGPVPPVPPPSPPPGPAYPVETHGPYQIGSGFETVNNVANLNLFPPNVPPALEQSYLTGPQYPGTYASEFGGSVISSFESMAPTLNPLHWGVNAPLSGEEAMFWRNWPVNSFVLVYAPGTNLTAVGEEAFKQQLYLAMLGQALEMKSDIEVRRSKNSFGTVTWQLNEIWPTGGWGSLEYGTPGYTAGQIIGGRWKPLHYIMRSSVYTDVFITCGDDGRCLVKNDNPLGPLTGTATIQLLQVATGKTVPLAKVPLDLPIGAGPTQWFCAGSGDPSCSGCQSWDDLLPGVGCSRGGCVVLASVQDAAGSVVAENSVLLTIPRNYTLPAASVTTKVGDRNDDGTVTVSVSSSATSLYVVLTTGAVGRFSTNAFHLAGAQTVELQFVPFGREPIDKGLLESTLRVEHLQQYL